MRDGFWLPVLGDWLHNIDEGKCGSDPELLVKSGFDQVRRPRLDERVELGGNPGGLNRRSAAR